MKEGLSGEPREIISSAIVGQDKLGISSMEMGSRNKEDGGIGMIT